MNERPARAAEAAWPVLVVDDDPLIQALLRMVCVEEGHDVIVATNGAEALEVLETNPVSIIVFDLDMPVMNGRTFFHLLQERGNERPTLLVSGHLADDLGVTASLQKPFDINEFRDVLSSLFRRAG